MEISVGMIVWLATGSPAMTVISKEEGEQWKCGWFTGEAFHEKLYTPNQLTDKETLPSDAAAS